MTNHQAEAYQSIMLWLEDTQAAMGHHYTPEQAQALRLAADRLVAEEAGDNPQMPAMAVSSPSDAL